MIHVLFNSWYWKAIVVIVLSMLNTFAHDVEALKDGVVCYMVFAMLACLVYTREDMGFVMLVASLFVLSYNNVVTKKAPKALKAKPQHM